MADGLPTWSSVMMTPGCTATATRLREEDAFPPSSSRSLALVACLLCRLGGQVSQSLPATSPREAFVTWEQPKRLRR